MRLPPRRRPATRQTPAAARPAARPTGPARGGATARRTGRSAGRTRLERRARPAVADGPTGRSAGSATAASGGNGTRRRPGRLTGRAAVLGLALCAVLLTLAYPMRQYLTQRQQISQLQSHQSAQRRNIAALEQRRRQWQDPAYVTAQARTRLQYVMPGEIGYVVLDAGRDRAGRPAARSVTLAPRRSTRHSAWYSQLWGTVQAADSAR